MKKELEHFYIGSSYGGSQDWMMDPFMRLGGCAALAACDSCIFFDRFFGTRMSECDTGNLTKQEYQTFSKIMKPYLTPRWGGVNKTQMYIDGFGEYLKDRQIVGLDMESFSGKENLEKAKQVIRSQIDQGYLIPYLMLQHTDPYLNKEYGWHWFLLNGYDETDKDFLVKAVTYSDWEWIDLAILWNTGVPMKGGMVLYQLYREKGEER